MPSKIVEKNVKFLRSMRSGASETVRDIIQEIITFIMIGRLPNLAQRKN